MKYQIPFLENECWWGGSTAYGCENPFTDDSVFEADYRRKALNQTMPLFLSNKGRYIWSEKPFYVHIESGVFVFEGEDIQVIQAGSCLRDAYIAARNVHFPFDGKELPESFFKTAQYNTWMEFTYDPTQEGVLAYAHDIIKNGLKPGILIIDEGWHGRYGTWAFDKAKFPDPAKMIKELHELGFIVMLWIVPLVCPDGREFIINIDKVTYGGKSGKRFIRNEKGDVALFDWWNGYSAMLDFTNPEDYQFLDEQLKHLINAYGVDGFKFDGGSLTMYHLDNIINGPANADMDPVVLNKAWNDFGRRYPYHEYKDTFKGGGLNCIQRLSDRNHAWSPNGIDTLIPCSVLQGLMGHPFICPDMIGGGEWSYNIKPGFQVDQELFVRMAQASALFPMMQFSWAPWKALDEKHWDMVKAAADLHEEMADEIIQMVKTAEINGEPILRNLEYNFPGCGYVTIKDEFMLGETILAAPVVTANTYEREVVFPAGNWQDQDGTIYSGPQTIKVKAPIEKLLWFRKK